MENRTDIVGVSLWERLRQTLRSHRGKLSHVGMALAGFILSNSYILGGVSPFGAAFCAAVNSTYTISAGVGAILGYTFTYNPLGNMKYIVTVLLIAAARWLFGAKLPDKLRVPSSAAIAFFALGISSSALLAFGDATMYDILLGTAELFLVCGATYFFSRALHIVETGWQGVNRSDISCVVVALAVILMGFASIRVAGMSLGRIGAVVAILLCARYGREAGGAISGITAGIALGLVTGDYTYLIVAYSLGGLVAGVFGGMGRIATAASFIFVNTITALFTMSYLDVYQSVFEIFLSTVIYIAIPRSWIVKTGIQGVIRPEAKPDTATQAALCQRLDDISVALGEISSTTQQVSEKLDAMEDSGYNHIYNRVAEQVCYHCGLKTTCWQFQYSDTVAAMNDAMLVLKKEGVILRDQMPRHFTKNCCKLEDFVAALNTRFQDHVSKEGVQRKVSKVRGVVTDQFEGMSMMLREIAGDLGGMRLLSPQKSKQVRDYFEKQGITPHQVLCFTDEYQRITVELEIPGFQVAKLHKTKMTLDLCTILDADLELPNLVERSKATTVQFCEKANFSVALGAYQIAAGGNRLCGDAYDFVRNKNGRAHMVLSDGMGSGGSAAVDSAMATGLIARLISVGIGHEAALKMVNSALLIKSGEESLATIDICSLDLFTGRASFYKAGAAPTYILKHGKAGYVESTSLPAGILRGVAFEKSSITLHQGDLVVMVSDGVIATGTDWVISELEASHNVDVQRICEKLATTAKLRRTDGREDDITVVAAWMQRGI